MSIENRPVTFDSSDEKIQKEDASITYNFEKYKSFKLSSSYDENRNFNGKSFNIQNAKENKPVLNHNGNSYLFRKIIFTSGCDNSTDDSTYEYSMVIELFNNIDNDKKLFIVLPIIDSENNGEHKPEDITNLWNKIDEVDEKTFTLDKSIDLNTLIPDTPFHYYY